MKKRNFRRSFVGTNARWVKRQATTTTNNNIIRQRTMVLTTIHRRILQSTVGRHYLTVRCRRCYHHLRLDAPPYRRRLQRYHYDQHSITSAATTACRSKHDAIITGGVPIVDLSLPIEKVGKDLHEACTTVGFFHLVNHGVSDKLRNDVLDEARRMFIELTPKQKESFSVEHSNSYRGYQRLGVNITKDQMDGHEGFDIVSESERAIRNPLHPDGITNFGHNLWPDPNWMPSLRPTIDQYVTEMNTVGMKLLQAASIGLGLPKDYFLPYFEDPYWSMRLIRYPPSSVSDPVPNTASTDVTNDFDGQPSSSSSSSSSKININDSIIDEFEYGVGTHTDYGVFTMILCEEVNDTLQILPKRRTASGTILRRREDDDEEEEKEERQQQQDECWLTVDAIPGGFVCNIGDMLARWTNGIYASTPHRVLRPTGCDRVSVPFFFDPSYDALIHPIQELVDQSNRPPAFEEPIMYGDHLLAKTSKNFQV